jgi:diguanylate cyclase (GGDEF)-like protein
VQSDELLAAARCAGFEPDPTLERRIDEAIASTPDDAELGRLYVAKAIALQGHGNATASANASCLAVRHLVASDDSEMAAFASALAAVFLDQIDELPRAIEFAVDAMVLLGEMHVNHIEAVRASLALACFFTRLSSFEIAIELGRRAYDGAHVLTGLPIDSIAYTVGYIAAEGGHVAVDDHTRDRRLADARRAARWLIDCGTGPVSRQMLGPGLLGEIAHALGDSVDQVELDRGAAHYAGTAPDLVAWHHLVRGTNARLLGDDAYALELLDLAIPGLTESADHHCLIRALHERAETKAVLGDLAGAYADAHHVAGLVRDLQIDQVGQLAQEVARRAELEVASTALRQTAERLTLGINQDPMTGARSRRWLEEHLAELEARGGHGSILMFDIDWFKAVNDTFGHTIGDHALERFARLLSTAGDPRYEVARFGGEEFVMIVDVDDRSVGSALAEQIRLTVAAHDWESVVADLALTTSVGAAFGSFSDVRKLLIRADEALLEAKRRGRNTIVVSPPFFAGAATLF